MSMVAELLDSIRAKRKEIFTSVVSEYESLVHKAAKHEQIDLDRITKLLDALDKDDKDFDADIKNKIERFKLGGQRDRVLGILASLPKLESEVKNKDDEITAFLAAKKPGLAEAVERLQNARREAESLHQIENKLRTVGVSQDLQRRKSALHEMQRERTAKRNEYEQRTNDAFKALRLLDSSIDQLERELSRTDDRNKRRLLQEEIDTLNNTKLPYTSQVENWQPLADEVAVLQKKIDAEQAAIEKALLVP